MSESKRMGRRTTAVGILLPLLGVLGVLFWAWPAAASDQVQQSFVLQPGWNSVYLEVEPEPNDTESVFEGLPVASVWTWNPSFSTVEFIQDPAEGLVNRDGWLGFFPRPRPEAFLTNLFIVQPNRAYLIKLEGDEPVTWTVSGRPSLRSQRWVTDSFNLVGLPVDPAAPPTFGDYFASSEAHSPAQVYRLDGTGVWQLVANPDFEPVQSGEAYWIYTEGASIYQGPLEVDLEQSDGLQYGATLVSQRVRFNNATDTDFTVTLRQLSSATPVEMAVNRFDPDTGEESWPALPSALAVPVPAGGESFVDLAVRRQDFSTEEVASVLEVTDGRGVRRRLAVNAAATVPTAAGAALRAAKAAGGEDNPRAVRAIYDRMTSSTPFAGLWVGSASVNGVSEAQTGGAVPKSTGRDFSFRLLVHVDGFGQARLLKEVIQLWQDGTMAPDPDDPTALTVDTPGNYVLLTDDSLIPNFQGASLRDGVPVGYRLSTVGYDFPGQSVDLDGSFAIGGTLSCTLTLGSDFPTNPFKHGFHPDHDNLDAQFLAPREEAYAVTRSMVFEFAASDPDVRGGVEPDLGDSFMAGTFRETLSGLHRNDIFVSGTFRLRRVAATPVLNQ
ncbi:MAG: hypothetical protein SX243_19000 [Acidobacteriota bacterium]|nr:hypothetical protein [Acidobacteriota bacterium]